MKKSPPVWLNCLFIDKCYIVILYCNTIIDYLDNFG